ncbi:MAG: phage tail tape measure protein [Brevundimonas sp.]|uniref:phage tail tape measure protein n=1 Tax=Brevundimonas sp. TaxID=1871086 RepID=UPI003919E4CC
MTDGFRDDRPDDVRARAAEATEALKGLEAPAEAAARAIETAFGRAGESLSRSLARAAADGELSLAELARAVLTALNAGLGSGRGGEGLAAAVSGAVGGLFGGARAEGGPVRGGGAYLVGERGPEVFRPAGGGVIEPVGAGGVSVTLNLTGVSERELLRSEAHIARALARATLLGARRL